MWRHHCVVGKGNVLKSLFRILLGYNWYINEPFSSQEKKKQGAQGYPIYLFWLKGEKSALKRTKI